MIILLLVIIVIALVFGGEAVTKIFAFCVVIAGSLALVALMLAIGAQF